MEKMIIKHLKKNFCNLRQISKLKWSTSYQTQDSNERYLCEILILKKPELPFQQNLVGIGEVTSKFGRKTHLYTNLGLHIR